jgi:hypothetical protein
MKQEDLNQMRQLMSEAVGPLKESIYDLRDELNHRTTHIDAEMKLMRMGIQNDLRLLTNRVHKVEDQIKESIKVTANYFEDEDRKLVKRVKMIELC